MSIWSKLGAFWHRDISARTAVGLIVGTLIATLLTTVIIPVVVPNQQADYLSFATIDSYGANNTSAMWTYRVAPERLFIWSPQPTAWAYFDADIRDIESSFNFSNYSGIGFYVMGMQEGQNLQFNLFTHNWTKDKEHEVYQYTYNEDIRTTTNWRYVEVNFSDFRIAPWQKDAYPNSQQPDLQKVFGFGLSATTSSRLSNTVRVDEMSLLDKNGSRTLIADFSALNATIDGKEALFHAGAGYS